MKLYGSSYSSVKPRRSPAKATLLVFLSDGSRGCFNSRSKSSCPFLKLPARPLQTANRRSECTIYRPIVHIAHHPLVADSLSTSYHTASGACFPPETIRTAALLRETGRPRWLATRACRPLDSRTPKVREWVRLSLRWCRAQSPSSGQQADHVWAEGRRPPRNFRSPCSIRATPTRIAPLLQPFKSVPESRRACPADTGDGPGDQAR